MKYFNFVVATTMCVFAGTCSAESFTKNVRVNNTEVWGTMEMTEEGEMTRVKMSLKTKKTGITGTGRGRLVVQFIDEQGNLSQPHVITYPVGSHFFTGIAEKVESKEIVQPKTTVVGVVWGVQASDTLGLPSFEELVGLLLRRDGKDFNPVEIMRGMALGQEYSIPGFGLIRIR